MGGGGEGVGKFNQSPSPSPSSILEEVGGEVKLWMDKTLYRGRFGERFGSW
jgi:hypothetical protein